MTSSRLPRRITDRQVEQHVIPAAAALIGAARANDRDAVDQVFAQLQLELRTDPLTTARALAVVLAATTPDDRSMAELLAWREPEHARLIAAGVPADTAAVLAAHDRRIDDTRTAA